jgi:hypothetical protein
VNETSCTATSASVTLPVLVMTKEYVMTSPACSPRPPVDDADLTTVSPGVGVVVNVALDGGDVTGLVAGSVPVATAVLSTDPASKSAWVTEYVAVQSTLASGARAAAPGGQLTTGDGPVPVNDSSSADTPVIVTFPVLVMRYE